MEGTVVEIIEKYLEWEIVKQQKGYSDTLRLKYDNDAMYYLSIGYSREEALHVTLVTPGTFGTWYINLFH